MVLTGWKKRKRHHARGVAFSALGMVALVGAGLAPASTAQGAIVEHTFSGSLDNIDGTPPSPWQDAALKSSFSVRYVFDTETPDLATPSILGRYDVIGLWVSIDGIELMAGEAEIRIENQSADQYVVTFGDLPFPGGGGIVLTGFGVLMNDDLLVDVDLGQWISATVFKLVYSGGEVNGTITSFSGKEVPAPACAIALTAMVLLRSRRERCHAAVIRDAHAQTVEA